MRDNRYDSVRGAERYGVRRLATVKMKRLWILVGLVVVASGAWAVLFQTNLMPKQRTVVSKFIEDLVAANRKGRIRGIVSSDGSFTALIDGQAVREGESIYGVTVVRILQDEVEFEKNGRQWTQGLNATPSREWRAGAEASAQAKAEADAKAQAEVEAKAQAEAQAKAQAEAEAKAQVEAEAKAKAEADAKAQAEAQAKAQAETEAKAQAETEAKAQAEVEAKAQTETEAKAQVEAEAKAKAEADAKAQAEAQAKAQAEAEAKAQEAEAKAKAEADAKAQAKAQAEAEAKAQAETEAKIRAEAEAKEEAEARTKIEAAKTDETVQENTVLRQPPADEGTQKRIAALIGQLGDKEPFVRDSVVTTLAEIGPPAVTLLINAMEDEDWVIRQGASQALGRIGDPQAVGSLIIALADKNQWIRQYAAEALGLIGDTQAVEPLVEALEDDNPNVREAAAKALVSIRGFATQEEQTKNADKKQANTIIGKLLDLKIYIGAGAGAVLLLGGLAVISVRRRKKIPEWGEPHHHLD